ncbi:hypothetical protein [Saccharothrix syringae]|uniref:Uncharacterized protein n=1 Tax=Saccharothrix syringae TaxID=103733 RepID=A0A5Q0HAQ3_SACSY|nr:hypothetical protein [Saccharothrix syringae]QFZ23013.1 hypothetical protein EKG83_41255 [Saccharothrix syringae]
MVDSATAPAETAGLVVVPAAWAAGFREPPVVGETAEPALAPTRKQPFPFTDVIGPNWPRKAIDQLRRRPPRCSTDFDSGNRSEPLQTPVDQGL